MHKIFAIALPLVLVAAASCCAQNQSAEFIESSSPLPGGGRVVSRSTHDSGMQTVAVGVTETVRERGPNSVLERPLEGSRYKRESVFRQSVEVAPVTRPAAVATGPTYPYPAAYLPSSNFRSARTALFHQPVRARATLNGSTAPYQISTLGLTNTLNSGAAVKTARQVYGNNCCQPPSYGPTTSLAVPAATAPVLQIQPPANQIPSLSIQDPSLNPAALPTQINPGIGVPQIGANSQNRFLSPFVSGSGAYQPIIRLSNMQPGTYLGQGIIGQPTAYVDGQPVRNLLRYIFP